MTTETKTTTKKSTTTTSDASSVEHSKPAPQQCLGCQKVARYFKCARPPIFAWPGDGDEPPLTDDKFCDTKCWTQWATKQYANVAVHNEAWMKWARDTGVLKDDVIPCLMPKGKPHPKPKKVLIEAPVPQPPTPNGSPSPAKPAPAKKPKLKRAASMSESEPLPPTPRVTDPAKAVAKKRKRPSGTVTPAPVSKAAELPSRGVKLVNPDMSVQAPFNTTSSARWKVTFQRPGEAPKHYGAVPNLAEIIGTMFAVNHVIPCEIIGAHTIKLYPALAADPLFVRAQNDMYVIASIDTPVTHDHVA